MKSYLQIIILCIALSENLFGQLLFESGIVSGGVTGAGFSTNTSSGSLTSHVSIPTGSTIKKAYLISSCDGLAPDITVSLNNINYTFNSINSITTPFISRIHPQWTWSNSSIRLLDITNTTNPAVNTYTLSIPPQYNIVNNGFYSSFYLYIIFENPNFNKTAYSLFFNTQNVDPFLTYDLNLNQPISHLSDVSLGVWSTFFGDTVVDGSYISLNNHQLGILGGTESNTFVGYSGVYANFSYYNSTLFGLEDDTPDNTMGATDALANISEYIDNNSNNLAIQFNYQQPNNFEGAYSNPVIGLFLAHSTPCDPFDVTVTPDTLVCLGSSIQLSATGGTRYEWQPATGLSCTNCPNPIATLDSSQLYTVRIWNNDSCSVVRPVKVNVRELPAFQSVNPVATACGTETGSVVVVANNTTAKPLSYSLNGGALETSSTFTGEFTELGAGTYTLTLQDNFGCQRDTVFTIVSNNTTQAQFTADPQSGVAPLTVSFTNTSTNASNYEWFVTSGSTSTNQGASLSTLTFDTSGVYTVTLVAWQNSSACADTFSVQILVFDTLVLQIPNVFTPNNDGVNDVFSITSNLAASYTFTLLNRWGSVVASKKSTFTPNVPEFLWDGKNATDGTYFYTLEVEWENETKKVEGFVVKISD